MADPEEIRRRMSEHLEECERCKHGLLCEEYEGLYVASESGGADLEEIRGRMSEHLEACERCDRDRPCAEWDELYANFESVGGNPEEVVDSAADQAPVEAAKALAPQVEVVTYKTPKDYQRDAQRRMADGWTIQAQSQETGQTHRIRRASSGALLGGFLMMPLAGAAIGGLSNKRTPGAITVTWVKAPVLPPARSSAAPESRAPESGTSAIASQLTALADLHRAGVLTDDEFNAKKAELLARM